MTCRRTSGGTIACSRGRRRDRRYRGPDGRPQRERPGCRVPNCSRYATQANWGCQPHFFRLPPDLRHRLSLADRDDQVGRSWALTAEEADRWIADHPQPAPLRDRRQRELLL